MKIRTKEIETIEVLVHPDSETGEIVMCPLVEIDGWEFGDSVEVRLSFDEAVQVVEKLSRIVEDKRKGRW